jgi:hypothetical protein
MVKILKIEDEQRIKEAEKEIQRFIFSDDKIVKVDLSGNVLTKNVTDKYLNLISTYNANGNNVNTKKDYSKIGGWLLTSTILLIISAVINTIMIINENKSVETLKALSRSYSSLTKNFQAVIDFIPIETFLVVVLIALAVASVVAILLRKKIAKILVPVLYALIAIFNIVVVTFLSQVNFPVTQQYVYTIIGAIVSAVAWFLYYNKSERVKQTLVK